MCCMRSCVNCCQSRARSGALRFMVLMKKVPGGFAGTETVYRQYGGTTQRQEQDALLFSQRWPERNEFLFSALCKVVRSVSCFEGSTVLHRNIDVRLVQLPCKRSRGSTLPRSRPWCVRSSGPAACRSGLWKRLGIWGASSIPPPPGSLLTGGTSSQRAVQT